MIISKYVAISLNHINSLNTKSGLINGDFKTLTAQDILISGSVDMGGNPITGLPLIPILPDEASSKFYVDKQIAATDSLQEAYDVGLADPAPSIITNNTIKALKLQTGTLDSDIVFKVIDTTNGTKFAIKGDGSTTTGQIDTVFNKIVNLAPGVALTDAVNLSQLSGVGTSTMQDTYDNSISPQITTDPTAGKQALVIKEGTLDSNITFAVEDTSGNKNFNVKGSGAVECLNIDVTGDFAAFGGSTPFPKMAVNAFGIDMGNNRVQAVGAPLVDADGANRKYVLDEIAAIPATDLSDLVSKTTLTPQAIASSLTTNGDVQLNTGALQIQGSTVQIQNSGSCQIQPTGILSLKEFSTTGNITMGGTGQIKNLAPGVALTDAVNLSQIPAPVSLVALEAKTQNINLTTSSGNTDITGTITLNNELTIPVVTSRNTNNIIIGDGGTGLTGTGEYNMVFGNGLAGNALTTGDRNVIVGSLAGELLSTGGKNVLIGTNTGDLLTSGGFNTIVGHGAGAAGTTPLSTGEDNLLLGCFANIDDNTNENIAIGCRSTASKGGSIALGTRATTTASKQLMIGGSDSTWGINSVVPGYITCDLGSSSNKFKDLYLSGQALIAGESTIPVVTSRNTNNYIVGDGGTGLTGTGEYNMVFGNGLAGNALTTGDRNVIVGALAGELLDTGEKNVLIGTNTGDLLTSGGFNTIVGHGAGASGTTPLSTGEDNLLLGAFSNVDDNTNENIAIGSRATSSGGLSIALGTRATTTASKQLMIGGSDSTWGINSVVPGYITCDLGSSANKFKDIYLSGKVETPSILADDILITGTNTLTIDSALLLVNTVLNVSDFIKYSGVDYLNPPGGNTIAAVGYVAQEIEAISSYAEYYWNSNITYSTPNAGLDTFGPVWASPAPLAQAGLSTSDWTFTAQTAELQYTGTTTREFSINANWCWEMGLTAAAAEDVQINLAVNGTPQAKLETYARLNDTGAVFPRNAGMCGFISLAPNDTIRMYAKVVTDATATHYYRNFNFTVRNI